MFVAVHVSTTRPASAVPETALTNVTVAFGTSIAVTELEASEITEYPTLFCTSTFTVKD